MRTGVGRDFPIRPVLWTDWEIRPTGHKVNFQRADRRQRRVSIRREAPAAAILHRAGWIFKVRNWPPTSSRLRVQFSFCARWQGPQEVNRGTCTLFGRKGKVGRRGPFFSRKSGGPAESFLLGESISARFIGLSVKRYSARRLRRVTRRHEYVSRFGTAVSPVYRARPPFVQEPPKGG